MSKGEDDPESVSRKKTCTAAEHLEHLLRIGHKPDSVLIRDFTHKYGLVIQKSSD